MSLPPLPPLPQLTEIEEKQVATLPELPPLPQLVQPYDADTAQKITETGQTAMRGMLAKVDALPQLPPITPAQALPLPPLPPLQANPQMEAYSEGMRNACEPSWHVSDNEAQALSEIVDNTLESISKATGMCDGCTPENCSGCKVDKAGDVDPGSRAYKLPWGVTIHPVEANDGTIRGVMKYTRPPDTYEPEVDNALGVTPWFGMHELPNPERRGEYEVKIAKRPRKNWLFPHSVIERHYWNGKNWPSLMGQFDAEAWRGLIERAV